jgi:HEAT repeat protein
MGLLSRFSGPPNVERLTRKKDVKGLLRALAYGEKREKREGERSQDVDAEVIKIELASLEALAKIGGVPAVPEVLQVLRTPRGHWAITFVIGLENDPLNPYALALAKFGQPAVPHLASTLMQEGSSWLPCAAAFALGHMGPDAEAAGPTLIEVVERFENQGAHLTGSAIWALARVEKSPRAGRALVDVLLRPNMKENYYRAAQALATGRFGPEVADALAKAIDGNEDKLSTSTAMGLAVLVLCLLKDRRGMEAALLPSNYPNYIKGGYDGPFHGDKNTLAALGNFDDPRVREVLRRNLDLSVAGGSTSDLLAFDAAFHAALGLAQLGDEAGPRFLAEALATRDLAGFYSSLWETTYDWLAKRALGR